MKFDYKAYDKLYPRPKAQNKTETAVEGFTPSTEDNAEEPETAVEVETEVGSGDDGADSSVSE